MSPSFLFLESSPVVSGDQPRLHSLASRMSYFLTLSPPDEPLMKRAADGSLREVNVIRSEAERLLDDPRHHRFLNSFCRQWLRLDKHENIAVSREMFPTYDDDLASAAINETLEAVGTFDSTAELHESRSRLGEICRLEFAPVDID